MAGLERGAGQGQAPACLPLTLSSTLLPPAPNPCQAFNLIGNAGLGTPGTGTVQSTEQQAAAAAAAKLEGTDAGLAQQQTAAGA